LDACQQTFEYKKTDRTNTARWFTILCCQLEQALEIHVDKWREQGHLHLIYNYIYQAAANEATARVWTGRRKLLIISFVGSVTVKEALTLMRQQSNDSVHQTNTSVKVVTLIPQVMH
jgi:hypothetical protein